VEEEEEVDEGEEVEEQEVRGRGGKIRGGRP